MSISRVAPRKGDNSGRVQLYLGWLVVAGELSSSWYGGQSGGAILVSGRVQHAPSFFAAHRLVFFRGAAVIHWVTNS